jgi:hypothetical protein
METTINALLPSEDPWAARAADAPKELIVYEASDGSLKFDPTAEEMAAILLHSPHEYWLQGGNGEAAIRVGRRTGDKRRLSHSVRRPDGTGAEFLWGYPEIWIKQPEPGKFYFTWSGHEMWIPYDGTGCEAYVMDERGGDPFKIARACLVDGSTAVEIVSEYLRTQARSKVVSWIIDAELPVPSGWYPWQ